MNEPGMVADDLRLEPSEGVVVISMRVRSKVKLPDRLWYEIPEEVAPPNLDADAFLPVLACSAFGLGISLKVESPVSENLLKGCVQAFEKYRSWGTFVGHRFEKLKVEAPVTSDRPLSNQRVGSFYSGGIDSAFTINRNLRLYPPNSPERIGSIVFVYGMDIPLENKGHLKIADETARLFSLDAGCGYIPVKTNARAFAIVRAQWLEYSHGPCLAGIGHLLAYGLKKVHIAATFSPPYVHPCSTDPEIDPLWSSGRIEFVHDGFETPRSSKIRQLCEWGTNLSFLRVCWQNVKGMMNCGRCSKCLSTVYALACLKKDGQAKTLDPELSLEKLRAMPLKSGGVPFWQDNISLAKQENRIDLAAEVEEVFRKHPEQVREAFFLYERHGKARASRINP